MIYYSVWVIAGVIVQVVSVQEKNSVEKLQDGSDAGNGGPERRK